MPSNVPLSGHMVTGIAMMRMAGDFARFQQLALIQRNAADVGSWHGGCNYPVAMKNTLLAILAVLATASLTQASDIKPAVLPEFTVNADGFKFIDERLEAVVSEQVAQTLAEPIPAKAIADANALTQPRIHFAISKDAMDIVLLASINS
jgi:hypothetical protein